MTKYVCPKITYVGKKGHNVGSGSYSYSYTYNNKGNVSTSRTVAAMYRPLHVYK